MPLPMSLEGVWVEGDSWRGLGMWDPPGLLVLSKSGSLPRPMVLLFPLKVPVADMAHGLGSSNRKGRKRVNGT